LSAHAIAAAVTDSRAATRVAAARTALVLDYPFFGVLALRLRVVEDVTASTAWTDGTHLGYSPAFVNSLSPAELAGIIAHEVMHCAGGHPWRLAAGLGFTDRKRANVAADYAINSILRDAGLTLPAGALIDPQWDGRSAEWIYARLPAADDSDQGDQGDMPGAGGEDLRAPAAAGDDDGDSSAQGDSSDSGGTTPSDGQPGSTATASGPQDDASDPSAPESPESWSQAVANAARMAGKGSGAAARTIAVAAASVDWRSALRRFIQESSRADYSWAHRSPRFPDLYMPAFRSTAMGAIAVCVDTSGSVDSVTLNRFGAELQAIVDEMQPSALHIIYADAEVNRVETLLPGDAVDLRPYGGGGTDFGPALEELERLDPAPVCAVYLTDLEGPMPDDPPAVPLLWGVTGRRYRQPSYGEVLEID